MKIPFDRVVINLKSGKYRGKIGALDYANTGHQLFNEMKFADQLGVSKEFNREIGLVQIKEFSGWHLPAEPTPQELESHRDTLEAEYAKNIAIWKQRKATGII